jgi:hypothetical protein
MDSSELWHLVTIIVIAMGALVAAPAVYFLFEGSRAAVARERRTPRRRGGPSGARPPAGAPSYGEPAYST